MKEEAVKEVVAKGVHAVNEGVGKMSSFYYTVLFLKCSSWVSPMLVVPTGFECYQGPISPWCYIKHHHFQVWQVGAFVGSSLLQDLSLLRCRILGEKTNCWESQVCNAKLCFV